MTISKQSRTLLLDHVEQVVHLRNVQVPHGMNGKCDARHRRQDTGQYSDIKTPAECWTGEGHCAPAFCPPSNRDDDSRGDSAKREVRTGDTAQSEQYTTDDDRHRYQSEKSSEDADIARHESYQAQPSAQREN